MAGCSGLNVPPAEPVLYTEEGLSPRLKTVIRTDHQGFHEISAAKTQLNKDGSLSIIFEPSPPAYWLGLELKVLNGSFRARPYGRPPEPARISFEIGKQELILQDLELAPGRIISGCTSINFIQHSQAGDKTPYFFTGCFSSAIYPAGGYTPFSPEHLAYLSEQDFELARRELSQPIHQARFMRAQADSFRAGQLGSGLSRHTEVLEATWVAEPTNRPGSPGRKHFSVWYTRQGDQWFPVAHKIWTRGRETLPDYLDRNGD